MKQGDAELDKLLKRLHLANARRIWRSLVERAEKEQRSFRDFLTLLVKEEIAQRQQTRLGRLSRWTAFPLLKTIDDFNFTFQSTVRLSLLGSALRCAYGWSLLQPSPAAAPLPPGAPCPRGRSLEGVCIDSEDTRA